MFTSSIKWPLTEGLVFLQIWCQRNVQKVCCMCRLVVLPSECILLFWCLCCCCRCCCYSSLFWSEGAHAVSWHGKIQHVFVYKKGTTGYYENIHVLLRGTFYTQEQWNFHHWMKTWIFCYLKLSEANIILSPWIIIASWTNILLKIFCSSLFFHLNLFRNLGLGG